MWGKGFLGRITQSNLIFISLLNYDTSDRTFTSSFLYTKFALILYVNHTSNTSVCYRKLPPSFFTSKIRKILIPQLLYPYMKEIGQSFKETVIQNFKNFRIIQVVLIKLLQIAECRYTRKFTKGDYSTYLHHFTLLLLWQTVFLAQGTTSCPIKNFGHYPTYNTVTQAFSKGHSCGRVLELLCTNVFHKCMVWMSLEVHGSFSGY